MMTLLSTIYGKVSDVRNRLYDRGIFDTFGLGASTISVGNLTTGGTGKTPLVAYVAELLAERGETVCILTRGYGRDAPHRRILVSDSKTVLAGFEQGGDEPLELARKLLGKAIVIADADRVAAAEWAKRRFGVTAFVLDDGFQHRRAKRDLDIVCIDATDPFGRGRMLPAGRLREPIKGLRRADAVVLTRADLVDGSAIADIRNEIASLTSAPIFAASNRIKCFSAIAGGPGELSPGAAAFAFCALGNPEGFFSMLRRSGVGLTGSLSFGDHHRYTQDDIRAIESRAAGSTVLLTTAKDAVKLSGLRFEMPCLVVETRLEIEDEAGFASLI